MTRKPIVDDRTGTLDDLVDCAARGVLTAVEGGRLRAAVAYLRSDVRQSKRTARGLQPRIEQLAAERNAATARAEQAEARIAAVRAIATEHAAGEQYWAANAVAIGEELLAALGGPTDTPAAEELHHPAEQAPPVPCDHRDPKRLACRSHDLAVICACGVEVMPGFRVRQHTEQERSFMADIQATFVGPLARAQARPDAEPERPAGWCPTCEGQPRRIASTAQQPTTEETTR